MLDAGPVVCSVNSEAQVFNAYVGGVIRDPNAYNTTVPPQTATRDNTHTHTTTHRFTLITRQHRFREFRITGVLCMPHVAVGP